jgi:DNA-directed RNA polymerase subunit RPC12/RpoP
MLLRPDGRPVAPPNVGDCYFCDRQDVPLNDVGALVREIMPCDPCLKKYGLILVRQAAAAVAEAAMMTRDNTMELYCGHCGKSFESPRNKPQTMCAECWKEIRARFHAEGFSGGGSEMIQ